MFKKCCLLLVVFFSIYFSLQAKVIMPGIFSDNMVLQRNILIPVWGWADAGEKIEVRFNKQVKSVKADKNGKWMLRLDIENAGGPYDLIIKGKIWYR